MSSVLLFLAVLIFNRCHCSYYSGEDTAYIQPEEIIVLVESDPYSYADGTSPNPTPRITGIVDLSICPDNSDECDETEANQIYEPHPDEEFMPPCCSKKSYSCDPHAEFRTFDGSCNNLDYPDWGVPNSTYSRLLPSKYGDGIRKPRRSNANGPLPSARRVRVALFPTGIRDNGLWNVNAMAWGQFVAHDMSLLKEPDTDFSCCTDDGKYISKRSRFCYPIKIPSDDPTMGKSGIHCVNFTRTVTDHDMGCADKNLPAQQINAVTAYLDLSNVYGLSGKINGDLRTYKDGKLSTEVRNGHVFAPALANRTLQCICNLPGETTCYKTGDSRANQNPPLTILQTLFLREHNHIAEELAKVNPQWNDERLFQEARRILIAIYQKITYYDWLPVYLGEGHTLDSRIIYDEIGFVEDYDPSKSPSVTNEHAHAAFRFFHTHIPGILNFFNSRREIEGSFSISDAFNRPQILEQGDNMEKLTMAMLSQNIQETDNIFVEEITDKMFACGRQFGIDLKATDIQRDRDHALSYYNDYRAYCGLGEAQSFEDYLDLISPEHVAILRNLYADYRDVDLSVGGSLEALVPGSQVGPTFLCILKEQFSRSRQADRFWFEHRASGLNEVQLAEVRKATVTRIYCDSGDGVTEMQPSGFTLIFRDINPVMSCSEIPSINFNLWKDDALKMERPDEVDFDYDDESDEYY